MMNPHKKRTHKTYWKTKGAESFDAEMSNIVIPHGVDITSKIEKLSQRLGKHRIMSQDLRDKQFEAESFGAESKCDRLWDCKTCERCKSHCGCGNDKKLRRTNLRKMYGKNISTPDTLCGHGAESFGGNTRKTKPAVFPKPKNIDVTKAHEIRLSARCHNDHMQMLGDKDMPMADYLSSKGIHGTQAIGRVYVCGIHNEAMRLQFNVKTDRDDVVCLMCKEASQ
tara:strand:- start:12848 stop:13519 length:672 start_codon:yes stop_codon:yes gene_type:complete